MVINHRIHSRAGWLVGSSPQSSYSFRYIVRQLASYKWQSWAKREGRMNEYPIQEGKHCSWVSVVYLQRSREEILLKWMKMKDSCTYFIFCTPSPMLLSFRHHQDFTSPPIRSFPIFLPWCCCWIHKIFRLFIFIYSPRTVKMKAELPARTRREKDSLWI